MHIISTLIALSLASLPSMIAQDTPPLLSVCAKYFPGMHDVCCDAIVSRGPSTPCSSPELVANITDCSTDKSPTEWACSIETDPMDPNAPDWGCAPNEVLDQVDDPFGIYPVILAGVREGASDLYQAKWAQIMNGIVSSRNVSSRK